MTLTIYHWKFTNKAVLFFFAELFRHEVIMDLVF